MGTVSYSPFVFTTFRIIIHTDKCWKKKNSWIVQIQESTTLTFLLLRRDGFYHLPFQTISQARNILLITKLLQSKQKIKYLLISLHISLFGCIFGCQFSNTPNYEYQKKHHFRTGKPEEKRRANHRECTYPYACDIRKPAHRVYNGLPH